MNYTERVDALFHERGYGNPNLNVAHAALKEDLVALLQEANREAINELHRAHAEEVSAHIETKKELQVYRTLHANRPNPAPCATDETVLLSAEGWVKVGDLKKPDEALAKRCAELEAEVARLKDGWDAEAAICKSQRQEITRLRDGWSDAETRLHTSREGQERLAAELRAVEEARKALAQRLKDIHENADATEELQKVYDVFQTSGWAAGGAGVIMGNCLVPPHARVEQLISELRLSHERGARSAEAAQALRKELARLQEQEAACRTQINRVLAGACGDTPLLKRVEALVSECFQQKHLREEAEVHQTALTAARDRAEKKLEEVLKANLSRENVLALDINRYRGAMQTLKDLMAELP